MNSDMKILDCIILGYEGPIFRAYLSVIRSLGYKVKKIIKLYNGHEKLCWLPNCFRNALLFSKETLHNNYWPIKFLSNKDVTSNMTNHIIDKYGLDSHFFSLFGKSCLDFSLITDESIYFDWGNEGWKNNKLFDLLQSLGQQTYLFTGGGLVPKRILELPNTEFVHVHPGFLPYTRGADGILWSVLTRGCPGAACFYMVPKLDEGHLILTEEYENLHFSLDGQFDLKDLYRLVFSFYDPAIRGLCLKHVLEKFGTLQHLPVTKQNVNKGITFHFMHDEIKRKTLKEIFRNLI